MSTKSVIGALAAGAVVGAVMGIMFDPISDKQHRKMHRCANNVFRTIGSIVDEVISM